MSYHARGNGFAWITGPQDLSAGSGHMGEGGNPIVRSLSTRSTGATEGDRCPIVAPSRSEGRGTDAERASDGKFVSCASPYSQCLLYLTNGVYYIRQGP